MTERDPKQRERKRSAGRKKDEWKSKYASGRDDRKGARERVMGKKIAVVVKQKQH